MLCPTPTECLELLEHYQVPRHIRDHARQVCRVAQLLGEGLVAAGMPINLPLLTAGALLHDIAKAAALKNGGNHAALGAAWLIELGYPAVAEIIAQHVWLRRDPATIEIPGEIELVNYADKRVRHTEIVSLAARFADLRHRYGTTPEALRLITANERRSRLLEARIFQFLSFQPGDIADLVQGSRS